MVRRLLAGLLLAAALPAPAGAAPVPLPAPPAARAGALRLADRLRPLTTEPSLATVLARAAAADGGTAAPLPARTAPLPEAPAHLRAPLGRLLAAVEDATALARDTVRPSAPAPVTIPAGGSRATVASRDAAGRAALATAAATVLAAVDDVRPVLAGATPRTTPKPACDVLDRAPLLCVGGEGANTHRGDYALLVDLGGDDRYTGATGGADVQRNGLPVSVAFDLGGDDTYAVEIGATTKALAALGAARDGVGILVDVAGDDSYAVRGGRRADLLAGFAGIGAATRGVGVLADLGGADRYTVAATRNGPTPAFSDGGLNVVVLSPVWGIGAGEAGIGVQLDTGGGADAYRVEARPAPVTVDGRLHVTRHLVRGLGYGGAGVGLAVDDGGTDSQYLGTTGWLVPPGHPTPVEPSQLAGADGFGSGGAGGVGAVVAGPGATVRLARAVLEVPTGAPEALLTAFGIGRLGGTGLVLDAGGKDRYSAWGSATAVRSARRGLVAEGGYTFVDAVGVGRDAGTGAVVDAAGDDSYEVTTIGAANVRGGGRTKASVAYAEAVALGAAASRGTGLLLDLTGADSYDSRVLAYATAATREVGAAWHVAQGSSAGGYGELRDLGGDDRYWALSYVAPEGPHNTFLAAQAGADVGLGGVGVLVDAGGSRDTFMGDGPKPCQGRRGDAVWLGCPPAFASGPVALGPGVAVGVNT